jgi:ABC-type cobalt transport system substrate-binding protein
VIKKIYLITIVLFVAASFIAMDRPFGAEWSGVDETVVEKFAKEAGRPPRDPYINTDQGDLLLFAFLLAGAVGGFIGGYYFRFLFHEKKIIAVANN